MSKAPTYANLSPGFTLTELLVVAAVIALLAGMLLPALAKTKATAAGVLRVNNATHLILHSAKNKDGLVYNTGSDTARLRSLSMNAMGNSGESLRDGMNGNKLESLQFREPSKIQSGNTASTKKRETE